MCLPRLRRYADVEFGRLQARDLLQHLWTGPISNSPVDIVQGSKSVEVRPVGPFDPRSPHCNKIAGALRMAEDGTAISTAVDNTINVLP